jgi:hypothetical protein
MSSKYVRNQFEAMLVANIAETVVDFTAEYQEMENIKDKYSLTDDDPFLGIQFPPSNEIPIGIVSDNTSGSYREEGVVMLHVVNPVTANTGDEIVDRGEALRDLFRGATINGDILIESVTTLNFESSATLNFENGYEAATITIEYYRNNNF